MPGRELLAGADPLVRRVQRGHARLKLLAKILPGQILSHTQGRLTYTAFHVLRPELAADRQSLGEPDPFRLRHRAALQRIVAVIIRARMDRKSAADYIAKWVKENIPAGDRERFREMAESELLGLHEGNYARYEIRPTEFAAWRQEWGEKTTSH